jgi:FkbM family methyltransferase
MNSLDCVVLDAGARYGLHPSWVELRGVATFHLFEMDPAEAARLAKKYSSDSAIHVHPVALFSQNRTLKFNVSQHRALNSMYSTDTDLLERNEYMQEGFSVIDELSVEAKTIDSVFSGADIHFLKLDIEGAELEALKGGTDKLRTSILGVRSEVCFAPVYKSAPLFGDIHRYLLDFGFELLNLDYTGQGNKAGRFARPARYGKLISSDAVWVINNDRLFAACGERLVHDLVRLAAFLALNDAPDLAVDVLLRAVQREGVSFDCVRNCALFASLHRKLLLFFKELTGLPMFDKAEIGAAYQTIFGREFPDLNRFYELDIFK